MAKKSFTKTKTKFSDFDAKDYFLFLFFIVIIGFVPVLVKYTMVNFSAEELALMGGEESAPDLFAYAKSRLLIVSSSIVLFCYGCYYFINLDKIDFSKWKTIIKKPYIIAFIVFAITIVLSTIFSEYQQVAWFGVWQRYEGLIVLLFYILIFFAAYDFCQSKFQTNLILYILTGSAIVIGFVGITQVVGRDFFATELAAKMVYGFKYEAGALLTPVFTQTYSTLYNPNCAGLYTVFTLPIFLSVGIFYPRKSIFKYILLGTSLIMLICLLGSNSAGGFTGLAVALSSAFIVGLIYILKFRENLNKKLYINLGILAVLGIGVLMLPFVQTKIVGVYTKFTQSSTTNHNQFTDIEVADNYVNLYMHEDYVHVWYDRETSIVKLSYNGGEEIKPLNVQQVPEAPSVTVANYEIPEKGVITIESMTNSFSVSKDGIIFYFAVHPDGTIAPLAPNGEEYDINTPIPSMGFEGRELFASSRGYIWSRSLPLVKENILLGTGPDTFIFEFPQEDIVGKTKYMGNPYIIVDKPHNMYLQTAINTGLVSLMAMLAIFVIYLWDTLRSLFSKREEDSYYFSLKFGLLIGITAYLVTSLTTDSSISVSPVFWALLGLGFSLNHILTKKEIK